MKRLIIILSALMLAPAVHAAQPSGTDFSRHEVRIGCGDAFFETLIWHDQIHKSYKGASDMFLGTEDSEYKHTPHFSASYAYHIFRWLSVGAMVDFQKTTWTRRIYDNKDIIRSATAENFSNLTILPTVRFNYCNHEHFGLYSSLSFGMDINGGSEKDGFGHNTVACFAADIRLIGVRAGAGHFWAFAEFGALGAMKNTNIIYMMGSSLMRGGLAIKF